jgi:hypothetical protein
MQRGGNPAFFEGYPIRGYGDCIVKANSVHGFGAILSEGMAPIVDGWSYSLTTIYNVYNTTKMLVWIPAAGGLGINLYNRENTPIEVNLLIACRWYEPYGNDAEIMYESGYVGHGVLPPQPGNQTIEN